jgi:hypothetical protein
MKKFDNYITFLHIKMDNPDEEDLEKQIAVLQAYRDIKVEEIYEAVNELEKIFAEYNLNIFNKIRLDLFEKYG